MIDVLKHSVRDDGQYIQVRHAVVGAQPAELRYVEVDIQTMLDQAEPVLAHPQCFGYRLDAESFFLSQPAKLGSDQIHFNAEIETAAFALAGLRQIRVRERWRGIVSIYKGRYRFHKLRG